MSLMAVSLNSPAAIEDYIITRAQAYNYPVQKAVAIASCESKMRQFKDGKVLSGEVNSKDKGVFQINEFYHLDQAKKMGLDIHTTQGNIEYGIWLMESEGDKHWKASKSCWKPKLNT
jgi:hypothetical protein